MSKSNFSRIWENFDFFFFWFIVSPNFRNWRYLAAWIFPEFGKNSENSRWKWLFRVLGVSPNKCIRIWIFPKFRKIYTNTILATCFSHTFFGKAEKKLWTGLWFAENSNYSSLIVTISNTIISIWWLKIYYFELEKRKIERFLGFLKFSQIREKFNFCGLPRILHFEVFAPG